MTIVPMIIPKNEMMRDSIIQDETRRPPPFRCLLFLFSSPPSSLLFYRLFWSDQPQDHVEMLVGLSPNPARALNGLRGAFPPLFPLSPLIPSWASFLFYLLATLSLLRLRVWLDLLQARDGRLGEMRLTCVAASLAAPFLYLELLTQRY